MGRDAEPTEACTGCRQALGVSDLRQLYADVPDELMLDRELDVPEALSEWEAVRELNALSEENRALVCFAGAGQYDHHVPAAVDHIIRRSEFYTAYTPYQPEVAQGTLQAIYEFQTMVCELTGMDVANASMYDGPSAAAEAAVMCRSVTRRRRVLAAREALDAALGDDVACVLVQYPNFYGCIEDLEPIAESVHAAGALLVVVADPVMLALLKSPGELGADVVVAEGQPFGNAPSFGGPVVGLFAAREKLVRKMPGRIVGATVDVEGRRGYVLTLQTREQQIRREKATSNICTNQGLSPPRFTSASSAGRDYARWRSPRYATRTMPGSGCNRCRVSRRSSPTPRSRATRWATTSRPASSLAWAW